MLYMIMETDLNELVKESVVKITGMKEEIRSMHRSLIGLYEGKYVKTANHYFHIWKSESGIDDDYFIAAPYESFSDNSKTVHRYETMNFIFRIYFSSSEIISKEEYENERNNVIKKSIN